MRQFPTEIIYDNNGLCIKCEQGVYPDVKDQCTKFVSWLQKEKQFLLKVTIYLYKDEQIRTFSSNKLVSAVFWSPNNKEEQPYIRISTGTSDSTMEVVNFNFLKSILGSISHEITHYFQWVENRRLNEREAKRNARILVFEYIEFEENETLKQFQVQSSTCSENSLKDLIRLYHLSTKNIKIKIIQTLASYRDFESAKTFLIGLTKDTDSDICCESVNSLSYYPDLDVITAVIDCLNSSSEDIRIYAARALQYIGNRSVIKPLQLMLDDKSGLVRGYAAVTLGLLHDETIIPILKQKLLIERSSPTRLRYYVALYYLGEESQLFNIFKELNSHSYLTRFASCHYLVDIVNTSNKEQVIYQLEKRLVKESRKEVSDAIKTSLEKIRNSKEHIDVQSGAGCW